jgi:hypothetical protein
VPNTQATELLGAVKVVCHESQATAVIEDTERGKPGCGQFSTNKHIDCVPTSARPYKPARSVGHVFFQTRDAYPFRQKLKSASATGTATTN